MLCFIKYDQFNSSINILLSKNYFRNYLFFQTDKKIIALLKGRFDQEEKDEVRKYDEWKKWQEEQKFINNKKVKRLISIFVFAVDLTARIY